MTDPRTAYRQHLDDFKGILNECQRDLLVLWAAEAFAHPADDAEPVTEDWLRSVGFGEVGTDSWPALRSPDSRRGGPVCHVQYEPFLGCDGWFVGFAGIEMGTITPPDCRGDVRRLAAALGITLEATA
jgi:hypothetical protein